MVFTLGQACAAVTSILSGKLVGVAAFFSFGEKRGRKKLPVRAHLLQTQRQQIVTKFVLDFFARNRSTPRLESITNAEVREVVLQSLLENGHFPPDAEKIDGDPTIYLGEQICQLDDDRYLVANIKFYSFKLTDSPSSRTFDSPLEAVACFVRGKIKSYMFSTPVI